MKFKLSFKKLFFPILRLLVVVSVIVIIWTIYAGGKLADNLLPGLIIILCIPVVPTLYLAVEYFIATKNKVISVDCNNITISFDTGEIVSYVSDQINYIELHKSSNMEKGNYPMQTAERYYHARIYMKDGKKIILTSVLDNDFEAALKLLNCNIKIRRTAYATIFF